MLIQTQEKARNTLKVCETSSRHRGGFRNDFQVRQIWIRSDLRPELPRFWMIYCNLRRFWYLTSRKWRGLNPPLHRTKLCFELSGLYTYCRGGSCHKDSNTVESFITLKLTCQLLIYTPSQWYSRVSRAYIGIVYILYRCGSSGVA